MASHTAGVGTYVRGDSICASLLGVQVTSAVEPTAADKRPVVTVVRKGVVQTLPRVGDIVTAKVLKLNPRLVSVEILCVGARPLETAFSGIIRLQDVRATEVDKLDIYDCFQPRDVIKAEVVSLGDARSYFLSTAKNELGVVYAKCAGSAVPMIPVSWQEMQCPETKALEKRKVAKTV